MRAMTTDTASRLRAAIVLAAALMFSSTLLTAPAVAAGDAPAKFMQRVSKELLRAHRANSEAQMTRTIHSRAAVASMGRFSLGTYYARLKSGSRRSYFNGMTKFMARYIISQSKTYRVARADIFRPSKRYGRHYLVDSRVTLTDGTEYNVQWKLAKSGKSFKVLDVNVLNFWVMPFQRNLFRSYVRKANGNVNALVLALNQ